MAWDQQDLFAGIVSEFADAQRCWGERISDVFAERSARRAEVVRDAQSRWREKNRQKMRDDWHAKYSPKAKREAARVAA